MECNNKKTVVKNEGTETSIFQLSSIELWITAENCNIVNWNRKKLIWKKDSHRKKVDCVCL